MIKPAVKLINGEILAASTSVLYTVPTTINRIQISFARLVNYTGGPITVNLYTLMSGESTANNFKVLDSYSLAANEEKLVSELIGDVIDAGGAILGDASSAASVALTLVGTQHGT